MTFAEICKHEPQLKFLFDTMPERVRQLKTETDFWRGWAETKQVVCGLVGWHARNPNLATDRIYDVGYQTIFDRYEMLWGPQ